MNHRPPDNLIKNNIYDRYVGEHLEKIIYFVIKIKLLIISMIMNLLMNIKVYKIYAIDMMNLN
jgi:hypothetical protein